MGKSSTNSIEEVSVSEEKEIVPLKRPRFSGLKLYLRMLSYGKAQLALIPSIITGLLPLAQMAIIGQVLICHTEYIQTGKSTLPKILNLTYYLLGLAALHGICTFLQTFLWARLSSDFTNDLKRQLFSSLMKNEVTFFDTTPIGSVLTLLGEDSQLVQNSFGVIKATQINYIVQFIAGIILCFVYAWQIALITLVVVPFSYTLQTLFGKLFTKNEAALFHHLSESMTVAEETLSSIRTVRSANREDEQIRIFGKMTQKVAKATRGLFYSIVYDFTIILCGQWALIIGNMYYGGKMVINGTLKGGDLFSVFSFMLYGCQGVIHLQYTLQGEQKAISSAIRILEMAKRVPSIPYDQGKKIKDFKGHIEFQNVSFKYPTRDSYVLKNISFEIKPGEIGALVGHSGSGKSTCVQLLERFYEPTEGKILLDGHDITTLNSRWLHQNIALVSQEPTLFHLTIKQNIKYGKRNATDEEVSIACDLANCTKFISKFEKGLDQMVGEKGSTVSGGQRQRIAIARALVKNPKVLITDEATSALDAGSEKKVQLALDNVMENRTSIIVAHRLTTIRKATMIYVFDSGKIVESGTHEELIENKCWYYELVKRQLTEDKIHGTDKENEIKDIKNDSESDSESSSSSSTTTTKISSSYSSSSSGKSNDESSVSSSPTNISTTTSET
ncbi:ATP-binding cassette sub-family B member 8, mitochondrial [Tritrichomonas foetus]|uniref:ATP-binding cassette sub-family B member 8, mitochondrial n=1 Tax=Tritrichomonas foetus TaxID=1144522 RepID=A0A1J4KJ16_9EUKA|nr:ATP-binding cassette sub-family B member 8, mitochondrial [Tritrichomonas foetus]|eukprot:OHT09325.1 ATP-binding cassette sub-family B member 8, mitochondrial [Tritrichomonas foetus]